jgi:putative phosphoribosyl transferase
LNREFALGAMAEDGTLLQDLAAEWANSPELAAVIAEEKERLASYSARFHPGGPPQLKDKRVLIVDDGLATGATMEVAVRSARKQAAAQVSVAIPVASDTGSARLAKVADRVIAVIEDPGFRAVGHYYQSFEQTRDDEVLRLLETRRHVKPSPPLGTPPVNP